MALSTREEQAERQAAAWARRQAACLPPGKGGRQQGVIFPHTPGIYEQKTTKPFFKEKFKENINFWVFLQI